MPHLDFVCRLLVLTLALGAAGCATRAPAAIYYDGTTSPLLTTNQTQFALDTDDFEILGPVRAEASSYNVLFIASWGDNGMERLLETAKRRYPEADEVINVRVDTYHLGIVLYLYNQVDLILTGTAIRYTSE